MSEIGTKIAKERLVDFCLFALACAYKEASSSNDYATFLSATVTNEWVQNLLSSSQQGIAQALSYAFLYRNYAYALTVMCNIATKYLELINNTENPTTKLVAAALLIGLVQGGMMIFAYYAQHEFVVHAAEAKRPNQEATEEQRNENSDTCISNLNSYELYGSAGLSLEMPEPEEIDTCQSLSSANKDMFSGHVATVATACFSMSEMSIALSKKYLNNEYLLKSLGKLFFGIGVACTAGTMATRVLGDCHTTESVLIASTKGLDAQVGGQLIMDVLAKAVELLNMAYKNPEMFVAAARGFLAGSQENNTRSRANSRTAGLIANSVINDANNPIQTTMILPQEEEKKEEPVFTSQA
jgi:hypothetical protein